MSFEERLAAYQQRCEIALEAAAATFFKQGSAVSKAARYALLGGGKRVRGVLVLAVNDMLAPNPAVADSFAAAIEMIHAFSLVHDDLPCMDDDAMRRGKPATHIEYGEDNALLAGDLLAIQAFEVVAHADIEAAFIVEAVRLLAAAAGGKGMIYGQELDLEYEKRPADGAALELIQSHKTGELIRAAAQLGVLAAGRLPAGETAVTAYAKNIGLVFQIVDDILDVTADQDKLGKPVGSDAQQGKSTFVSIFGLENARQRAAELTKQAVETLGTAYGPAADFLCQYANNLSMRIW